MMDRQGKLMKSMVDLIFLCAKLSKVKKAVTFLLLILRDPKPMSSNHSYEYENPKKNSNFNRNGGLESCRNKTTKYYDLSKLL